MAKRISELPQISPVAILPTDLMEVERDGGLNYKATVLTISGYPSVNVMDYGADNTGVADSSAAFQAAVVATDALSGGVCGDVIVPAGIYSAFDIPISAGAGAGEYSTRPITFKGASIGATTINVPAGESGFILDSTGTIRGGGIYDMSIVGDGDQFIFTGSTVEGDFNGTTTGIDIDFSTGSLFDFTVERCDIRAHATGIKFINRNRSPKINDCSIWFNHTGLDLREHPFFGGSNDFRHSWNCVTGIASTSGDTLFDAMIANVKFMHCAYGVRVLDGRGVANTTFTGCIFGFCRETSVEIRNNCSLNGCYFISASSFQSKVGVLVRGVNNTIEGCRVDSFTPLSEGDGRGWTDAVIAVDQILEQERGLSVVGCMFGTNTANSIGRIMHFRPHLTGARFDNFLFASNSVNMSNAAGVQVIEIDERVSYSAITGNALFGSNTGNVATGSAITTGAGTRNLTISGNSCQFNAATLVGQFFYDGLGANSVFTSNVLFGGDATGADGFNFSSAPAVYDLNHWSNS
jgi:hypothetical protein